MTRFRVPGSGFWVACAAVSGVLAVSSCATRASRNPEPGTQNPEPVLTEQTSNVTIVLQAVSAVSEEVAWVSGHGAAVLRTTDGGVTWERLTVPGAEGLEFRDVQAFDANTAYLLAAGPGDRSRIFKTADGGRTWVQQYRNQDSSAFYDCFAFFDRNTGLVVSDAVNGRLLVRATQDGGASWDFVPEGGVPAAVEGEGAFAASGTCLVSVGRRHAWIAAAGASEGRVYRSTDRGRSWGVAVVPLVTGSASGPATVAFRDTRTGVALGGRLGVATDTNNHVAVTTDGGVTWIRAGRPTFPGAVFGSAWVPGTARHTLVAAGPGGLSLSRDDGATWTSLGAGAYWAVGFASARAGWAVGPRGRITRITLN